MNDRSGGWRGLALQWGLSLEDGLAPGWKMKLAPHQPGFRRRMALNGRGFDHVAGYGQLVANLCVHSPRVMSDLRRGRIVMA